MRQGTEEWKSRLRQLQGVWQAMKQRCQNPNNPSYKNYGGRGIQVCSEWMEFKVFIDNMGIPPEGWSLGRVNNDRGYCPVNCVWKQVRSKSYQQRRIELFERKTVNEKGCWIWSGSVGKDGYGIYGPGKLFRVHRASYILWVGEIPKGLFILHKCDTPLCFNPDHLYAGDAKQNAKDAVERGLHPTGPNSKKARKGILNTKAVLSENDVLNIRACYCAKTNGPELLSKKYKVDKSTIHRVISRRSWSHI